MHQGHAMQTPGHDSHDTDAHDVVKTFDHASHREWQNRTPLSEVEKGDDLHLGPTVSKGPTVHEKVTLTYRDA
jgi:hypothetical protein